MGDRLKELEAQRHAAAVAQEAAAPPAPKPKRDDVPTYDFMDDWLYHVGTGRRICHVSTFPEIKRCAKLNDRANKLRSEGRMGRELFR